MEKGHRRLQYVGEHRVVEIFTSVRANLHEEYVLGDYHGNADNHAKSVHVYNVDAVQETVLVQTEHMRQDCIVQHVKRIQRLERVVPVQRSPYDLDVRPVGDPIVVASRCSLSHNEHD